MISLTTNYPTPEPRFQLHRNPHSQLHCNSHFQLHYHRHSQNPLSSPLPKPLSNHIAIPTFNPIAAYTLTPHSTPPLRKCGCEHLIPKTQLPTLSESHKFTYFKINHHSRIFLLIFFIFF